MWQAHSLRAILCCARDKKQELTVRGSLGSAARFIVCNFAFCASTALASESQVSQSVGADSIFNASSMQSRVLGGGEADVGAWPSMAAIVIDGDFPLEDRFFCGGTVISQRWILTAAHCLYGPFGEETQPADIRVVVGIVNLQDEAAADVVVSNVYVHPLYNTGGGTLINDIALLELATAVTVPTTTLFDGDPSTYNESLASIVGWGATGFSQANGTEIYPNILQEASVPIVSHEQCNSPESYQGGIVDTQICAGYREGGVDSCVGDSGGPLFLMQNGKQVQVGITSFGNGCGRANFYGVYTNIAAYRTWINDYIDISESGNPIALEEVTDTSSNSNSGTSGGDEGAGIRGSVAVGSSATGGGSLNYYFLCLLLGFAYLRGFQATLKTSEKLEHLKMRFQKAHSTNG